MKRKIEKIEQLDVVIVLGAERRLDDNIELFNLLAVEDTHKIELGPGKQGREWLEKICQSSGKNYKILGDGGSDGADRDELNQLKSSIGPRTHIYLWCHGRDFHEDGVHHLALFGAGKNFEPTKAVFEMLTAFGNFGMLHLIACRSALAKENSNKESFKRLSNQVPIVMYSGSEEETDQVLNLKALVKAIKCMAKSKDKLYQQFANALLTHPYKIFYEHQGRFFEQPAERFFSLSALRAAQEEFCKFLGKGKSKATSAQEQVELVWNIFYADQQSASPKHFEGKEGLVEEILIGSEISGVDVAKLASFEYAYQSIFSACLNVHPKLASLFIEKLKGKVDEVFTDQTAESVFYNLNEKSEYLPKEMLTKIAHVGILQSSEEEIKYNPDFVGALEHLIDKKADISFRLPGRKSPMHRVVTIENAPEKVVDLLYKNGGTLVGKTQKEANQCPECPDEPQCPAEKNWQKLVQNQDKSKSTSFVRNSQGNGLT